MRLRFFAPDARVEPSARSAPVYDREMALAAQHDGMTLGVAPYSADPKRLSAEFAVAVRGDWHGRGVGHLLMARLIEVAQQFGIGELPRPVSTSASHRVAVLGPARRLDRRPQLIDQCRAVADLSPLLDTRKSIP